MEQPAATGAHADLEKTASRRLSHTNVPPPELMPTMLMPSYLVSHLTLVQVTRLVMSKLHILSYLTYVKAKLGYKQELRRNFTMIEVFGIAFSIMGLLPSIASTLSFSIPAGPVGMVWGWFLASMFIFIVGVAMADLGSAMPTSGGLYWW